jgi:hypothetical protein
VDGLLPEDERLGVLDAHPHFHAAADDSCPDIVAVTCPDCGAELHFDPSTIKRKSYDPARITDPARIEWLHPGR